MLKCPAVLAIHYVGFLLLALTLIINSYAEHKNFNNIGLTK